MAMTKAEVIYKRTEEVKQLLRWPWAWKKLQAKMDSFDADLELQRIGIQEEIERLTEDFIRGVVTKQKAILEARLSLKDLDAIIAEEKVFRTELKSEVPADKKSKE
jgi:hypothetical protein